MSSAEQDLTEAVEAGAEALFEATAKLQGVTRTWQEASPIERHAYLTAVLPVVMASSKVIIAAMEKVVDEASRSPEDKQ